jgi:O-antigen ligase
MTPPGLTLWAALLAVGWLLPNHYLPWLSFHADAWVCALLLMALFLLCWHVRTPVSWPGLALVALVLCLLPWAQHVVGQVPLAGTAWITSIFLLGLSLAVLAGARWETACPGQLADGLFLAIGIAAIASVGLQLREWLQLEGLELWVVSGGHARPHANFGQPNQLGTFLLWGLLAVAWGVLRQQMRVSVALLMTVYLLFGLALTRSRTAWVAMLLLVAAAWWWRPLWRDRRVPWLVSGLALYFLLCVVGQAWLQQPASVDVTTRLGDYARMSGDVRPQVWAAFWDAAWRQPLQGYGWGQVVLAQMAVAAEHPHLHGVYLYAHNLFLDLVLWCGIPLGVLIAVFLLGWLGRRLMVVRSAENAVLLLFLLVIGNHAMLEMPLHHAYFLLPVGLVIGAINVRMDASPWLQTGRWALWSLALVAATLLVLLIRDYARVENSFQKLRMEWSGIRLSEPARPPEVLLLTQWNDYLRYARFEPRPGLDDTALDWARHVTGMFPNAVFFHKLAATLALNRQPDEARHWLQTMCKVVQEAQCRAVEVAWSRQAQQSPELAAVNWPGRIQN